MLRMRSEEQKTEVGSGGDRLPVMAKNVETNESGYRRQYLSPFVSIATTAKTHEQHGPSGVRRTKSLRWDAEAPETGAVSTVPTTTKARIT